MKELLLATKLRVPRLPVQHVPRPRLVKLLEKSAAGSLTLVAAPAGSGKTTLLAEWARATSLPVAWLALESADNEPRRLLSYLQASLQTLDARLGQHVETLPDLPSSADYQRVLSALINDVLVYISGDAVLVLDDYHALEDDAVHDLFIFWLEHAPEHLHLVLGTRVDPPLPLSRLRARGRLSEIHADVLRFAGEEVAAFLQAMDLQLGAGALDNLEQRTEGWIAGVQLAALALRGCSDPEALLSSFHGNHRFIREYISDEILVRQTPQVRTFLLRTSILERLNGALCDAVMEQEGSQAVLEELRRANLFVSALDETGEWYRYHALFAESLRHQLEQREPEQLPALYMRASGWFASHNMLYEACECALQAGDFAHAASLLERLANKMIGRVEFTTLRRWLALLPEEIIANRPILRVAATWLSLTEDDGHPALLEKAIATLQQSFDERAIESRDAEWMEAQANLNFIRIMQALGNNRTDEAIELAQQTLRALPEHATSTRRLAELCIQLAQSAAYRIQGNLAAAEEMLVKASESLQQREFHFLNLVALVSLIEMYEAQGALAKLDRLYRQLLQMLRTTREMLPEMTIWIAAGYARLMLEWNRLDEADEYIRMAEVAARGIEIIELTLSFRLIQIWISHVRGREQEVRTLLREMDEDMARLPPQAIHELEMQTRVRILLRQGQLDEAIRRVRACGPAYDDAWQEPPDERVFARYLSLARVLIAQARAAPQEAHLIQALELLDRLRLSYEKAGFTGRVIEILVLTALALQAQGETSRALTILGQAVSQAEPGGFIRLFVDEGQPLARLLTRLLAQKPPYAAYIRTLLAAYAPESELQQLAAPRPAAAGLAETLSAREREVLALLANGSSNQEIAARLVIAPNTAKRHVKNILGKLAASNRTQAVARAREAGLLTQN
ncbi:MAG TPA: LuxR C-terminal-related transcriptional regulator [Ktedonobacteraceae bacterium]|nr:LuxR C-terminal-related transcriptional regulator [Ktedonobacteraceae bacterium]